mmetsp:Transcript_76949/g.213839  ORF Transcript_76949/g.213839 Transcript_76949/m.213839 type:complete len:269 (+) Transcript_76949:161-967(+)
MPNSPSDTDKRLRPATLVFIELRGCGLQFLPDIAPRRGRAGSEQYPQRVRSWSCQCPRRISERTARHGPSKLRYDNRRWSLGRHSCTRAGRRIHKVPRCSWPTNLGRCSCARAAWEPSIPRHCNRGHHCARIHRGCSRRRRGVRRLDAPVYVTGSVADKRRAMKMMENMTWWSPGWQWPRGGIGKRGCGRQNLCAGVHTSSGYGRQSARARARETRPIAYKRACPATHRRQVRSQLRGRRCLCTLCVQVETDVSERDNGATLGTRLDN